MLPRGEDPLLAGAFELACRLSSLAALPLRWFFVIAVSLDVSREPLTLTEAFEPLQGLLNGLIPARPNFDHYESCPFQLPT